jgi:hypothetical protein
MPKSAARSARVATVALAFVFLAGSASGTHAKRPRGADLTVRSLMGPAAVVRGATFRFVFAVANNGARTAKRSKVRAFLARDTRRGRPAVRLLGAKSIPPLAPGAMARETGTARVPRRTGTGQWSLIVCAAAERDANSRNNCQRSSRRTTVWKHVRRGKPRLRQVDGGPRYYAQFANGLPTTPAYFPIGAWIRPAHDQEHFGDYRNFGMNLFVAVEAPGLANEAMIRANGMRSLIQADARTRFRGLGSEVAGWLLEDEVDMRFGPGSDTVNCRGRGYDVMRNAANSVPADRRFHYANYGKGVLEWNTDAQSSCWINRFQQVVSTDYYWFTDPNARGDNPLYGLGSSYGENVKRVRYLDGLDGKRMPVWNFVELGWPWSENPATNGGRILPAEIRSAVWHSIIAGARGIIYFDHNFGPGTPDSTIMEEGYEDNRIAASRVNAQIKRFARVLNARFVTSRHSATDTMDGTVRYMVKWANGKFWVFAGADRGGGSVTFSIPCVGSATAVIDGESRSLAINNGAFTDSFADKNAVHIYRIDGGSSCGLAK